MSTDVRCALLLLTGQQLDSTLADLNSDLKDIISATSERLVVWVECKEFDQEFDQAARIDLHTLHRNLTQVYIQTAAITHHQKKPLFAVDVVFRSRNKRFTCPSDMHVDTLYYKPEGQRLRQLDPKETIDTAEGIQAIQEHRDHRPIRPSLFYPNVVLGGTFDHLHAGHKILLTMAALLATEKLIIGMTSDKLLTKKAYAEVLEPLDVRIRKTEAFLQLVKPGIIYDLVPIEDVYGPTGWDPDIQALVVSKETLSGAKSIREHRKEHELPALREFVIDVIAPDGSNLGEDVDLKDLKISSTAIRKHIATMRKEATEDKSGINARF